MSSLEINTSKTEAMWLGQWKNNQDTPFGFKWPKEPILPLAVFFSHNHNIIHLDDLLNEHSNFYKFHEFKAKYNFDVPFTVFYGLNDAIRNAWKDKIKQQNQSGKVNQNDNTTLNTSSIYYFREFLRPANFAKSDLVSWFY